MKFKQQNNTWSMLMVQLNLTYFLLLLQYQLEMKVMQGIAVNGSIKNTGPNHVKYHVEF